MTENWAERQLDTLTRISELTDPQLRDLALRLADGEVDRGGVIRALVDEVRRRFVYAPDPTLAEFFKIPFEFGSQIDIEDACLFVVALAKVIGIPCRFVLARYRERAWTVFLAYEDEERRWVGIDPLRQKTTVALEEFVIGGVL